MAFVLFRDLGVETAVVEVGLGGRLDATNVVEPALTVVTPIDFDHEAFLGSSLESIAAEKAGIFKEGVPAVVSVQSAPALEVLESVAAERNVRLIRATDYHRECVEIHAKGSKFRIIGCNTLEIQCPLAGAHQIDNATTAVAALEALGISAEAIRAGIASAQWPGRLETVSTNPCIILDGAHNPAGARALAEYIREFFPKAYVQLIFGAMRDKSVQEITEILFPMADEVILTAPSSQRAIRPEAIAHTDTHPRLRLTLNVAEAIGLVKAGRPGAVCFITGSLYIVGEARALLVQ
jgi:dihydrofolate synthase/folylpolyglutamate synthase